MIKHVHKKQSQQEHPFKMVISGFKYAAGHYQLLLEGTPYARHIFCEIIQAYG
jgi:hypothetical protein